MGLKSQGEKKRKPNEDNKSLKWFPAMFWPFTLDTNFWRPFENRNGGWFKPSTFLLTWAFTDPSADWKILPRFPWRKRVIMTILIWHFGMQSAAKQGWEMKKRKRKKKKETYPQAPTALDAILAQCGFYLHPITHKHPNVTLLLRPLLSSMW